MLYGIWREKNKYLLIPGRELITDHSTASTTVQLGELTCAIRGTGMWLRGYLHDRHDSEVGASLKIHSSIGDKSLQMLGTKSTPHILQAAQQVAEHPLWLVDLRLYQAAGLIGVSLFLPGGWACLRVPLHCLYCLYALVKGGT